MHRTLKFLFGIGASGKRQAAWAAFLFLSCAAMWVMWKEAGGAPMPGAYGLLSIMWPLSLAGVIGTHSLDHMKPEGTRDDFAPDR